MRYRIKKIGKRWWILGDNRFGPLGPYETQTEAKEDCQGLNRFLRLKNEPGYITTETLPTRGMN